MILIRNFGKIVGGFFSLEFSINFEFPAFFWNLDAVVFMSIFEAFLQLYSHATFKGSAKNSKVHDCWKNFSDFCYILFTSFSKNHQSSTDFYGLLRFCQNLSKLIFFAKLPLWPYKPQLHSNSNKNPLESVKKPAK